MYAKDPELPSLLVQIPRKESLCVSRILGATLSADNCSTARLGQSRLSERIMEIAKQKGITDKKKLVVHYGHCQNHMRNGWCNAIGIRFEQRALDTLQHDIPLFAHHLRIGGELNNLHRWVIHHYYRFVIPSLCHTHLSSTCFFKTCRLTDKEINDTCNDVKGHGEQCHVFCEKMFPGRVKIPITRVLGGARFDVIFEACVGNYHK